uniref:Uncharacterized protein n=1 Tax=Anopheles minimus TaxID=112268 RepID=A0A182WCQ5_9DIPT
MVNLCSLLLKYNNFSQVEDDIFLYIDRILENAFEIHKKQTEANKELASLEALIAEKQKCLQASVSTRGSRTPVKKRKVQSLDSSRSACKENASILEDSSFFPHKSDSDVSSMFDQNIIDSDEPFFALTQTPPPPVRPVRQALSPRNEPSSNKPSTEVRAVKLLFGDEIKSPKKIIRESRFVKRLTAVESSPGIEKKPTVLSTVPPTSNGKWTGKKSKGNIESPKSAEHTPTGLKRFHSLTDSNQRFRQAKLNFPRQNKRSPGHEPEQVVNDTLFSDFVVPTPPSVASKSKFLKSLRMKKQSTMISKGQSEKSAAKETYSTAASSTANGECNQAHHDDEDEDDINQTYCSGIESINRIVKDLSVKVKQEPDSQLNNKRNAIKRHDHVANQQWNSRDDSETNEVIFVGPPSQQSIVTVVESQNENDKFISELHNEQAKRVKAETGLGISSIPSNNVQRTNHEYRAPSGGAINHPYNRNMEYLGEGLCNDCMKLFKFHTTRGVSNDAARTKLPRNCRSCRMAQLHHTPPGFWDPDFLPTPQ